MRNHPDDLVLLGKILGAHGIRGDIRVICYSGVYDTLLSVSSFFIRKPDGKLLELSPSSVRIHSGRAIVALNGFSSINDISPLLGLEIMVNSDQLPPLDEGEFYWRDLIGLKVFLDSGDELGSISEIIETAGNDVYVVSDGEREYLIPAVEDVVLDINVEAGKVTVCPFEGLLDL